MKMYTVEILRKDGRPYIVRRYWARWLVDSNGIGETFGYVYELPELFHHDFVVADIMKKMKTIGAKARVVTFELTEVPQ